MSDQDSREVFERYREGDSAAGQEIFDRYMQRLIALVRSRLTPETNRRFDADEIASDAMKSLLINARKDCYEFKETGDLWRMLTSIAVNKALELQRFHRQKKRAVSSEESGLASGSVFGVPIQAVMKEPTPEEGVMLSEQLELALAELSPSQRAIVELRLQGYEEDEIMERVARSRRTVERALEEFRKNLERQFRTLSAV